MDQEISKLLFKKVLTDETLYLSLAEAPDKVLLVVAGCFTTPPELIASNPELFARTPNLLEDIASYLLHVRRNHPADQPDYSNERSPT